MRVGLIIYGSLDMISGGYLYDRMLVNYLLRQGEKVDIIALPGQSYARHLMDNLSPALYRRLSQAIVDLMLQDELNHPSLFWLNHRLRSQRLHETHSLAPKPGKPKKISIVHHLRSSEDHPAWLMKLYRWVERRYLRSVDGFIFNSQTTRQAVEALAGSDYPSIVAYPAGDQFHPTISQDFILGRAHQDGPLKLLFVGNIIPRKGLHTLLAALRQTPEGTAALTVVGEPAANPGYWNAIQKQVSEGGLQMRVSFLGQLSQGDLEAQIRSHHIMVVPSTYEGFGIVYLEGMGFGLPAIGTTSGAAAEIITHGQDGYLVNPDDPARLSHLLVDIHQDRSKLALMSLAARQRYLAHPTWDETCTTIHSFLRCLIIP